MGELHLPLPRQKGDIEEAYARYLEPFATVKPREGSREHLEEVKADENRSDFQRDRDRIIHSKAFRGLMYKTQVFVNHEGDYFRTRLTHTLEVAQFSRGICKSLGLNEDLAEAIAFGHDLGHTPFGHAVERYLDEELSMREMGRYYHNEQSVRVVDFLEHRTDEYNGLNLTWEVREGILKHNKDDRSGIYTAFSPNYPCSTLEGQAVGLMDTVAYICHDLQDAIQAGLIENAQMCNEDFATSIIEIRTIISDMLPDKKIDFTRFSKTYFINDLIHYFIMSITNASAKKIKELDIQTTADVKRYANEKKSIVCMEEEDSVRFKKLKKLIYKTVYTIHTIQTMDCKAKMVVERLFNTFVSNPKLLPPSELEKYMHIKEEPKYDGVRNNEVRVICDYISGMTDRIALEEYERIMNPLIKI